MMMIVNMIIITGFVMILLANKSQYYDHNSRYDVNNSGYDVILVPMMGIVSKTLSNFLFYE